MRLLAILLFMIFPLSAFAELGLYTSIESYIQEIENVTTNNEINKHGWLTQVSPNKKWHVVFKINQPSRIHILKADNAGILKIYVISKIDLENPQPSNPVDDFGFNGNNSFYIAFAPTAHTRVTNDFSLIKGKWYLVSENRTELAQCGQGDSSETFYSLESFTNYITGGIKEQRYSEKDCKPVKLVKKKRKFSLVPLSDFYPFMEIVPKQ